MWNHLRIWRSSTCSVCLEKWNEYNSATDGERERERRWKREEERRKRGYERKYKTTLPLCPAILRLKSSFCAAGLSPNVWTCSSTQNWSIVPDVQTESGSETGGKWGERVRKREREMPTFLSLAEFPLLLWKWPCSWSSGWNPSFSGQLKWEMSKVWKHKQ